jgi:CubicO group peptidase (beta-lactamase class C family)
MTRILLLGALLLTSLSAVPAAQAVATKPDAAVDEIFAKWTTATPGCAVGVAVGGKPVLLKAYGMADLEHDVRNTPDTIFESGSLSKQFTAMAVQLLAGEGKLSLDDPVRKYVPELPDYGKPLTIRHMLSHTSGLRDWGSVESIAGWPRTTREYTHAHVLDIVSRQKSLNFDPGTNWSYSNTGFNLAAVIVSRVSGMSFAEFSTQRIFAPLGMKSTSWRDDHTRIVKGRAIAYSLDRGEYHIEMPFENVHGNGGLLTTVGDLLVWNENLVNPKVGTPKLIAEMSTNAKFSNGKTVENYGLGLFIEEYRGVHNVYHSGSTAGYRAHLNRFPDSRTSVAVLCNGSNGDASRSANYVSDVILGDRLKPAPTPPPAAAPPAALNPPPTAQQLSGLAGS